MRGPTIALLLVAGAVLGACDLGEGFRGGDGTLSAGEYRSRANGLCREAENRAAEGPEPTTVRRLVDYMDRQTGQLTRLQREFERLTPPPTLAADHRVSVRQSRETIVLLRRTVRRARASVKPRRVVGTVLPRLEAMVDEGNVVARRLGLEDCVAESFVGSDRDSNPS